MFGTTWSNLIVLPCEKIVSIISHGHPISGEKPADDSDEGPDLVSNGSVIDFGRVNNYFVAVFEFFNKSGFWKDRPAVMTGCLPVLS